MSAAALIAWVLRHEVLVGWLTAVVGALGLTAGLYAFGHHAGVASQAPLVAAAQSQARTATAQTGVTAAAAQAADRAAARTVHITARAEEAVHDIRQAPGADQALDPDLLARWRAQLVGLRAAAAAAPDGSGGGQPAESVSGNVR